MPEDFDLKRVPIFHRLTEEESDRLEKSIEQRSIEHGQTIFKQGDDPDALYIVKEGEVDIVMDSPNGEVILATVSPGSFFGELGIFDNVPRSATARATRDTNVLLLRRDVVMDFLEHNPSASLRILAVVISRLRLADQMMTRLVSRNVNEILESKTTIGQRIADKVASFGGSWTFIIIFACFLFGWMGVNMVEALWKPWDPFPFIFLNLILSCLAAIQAPIIMMSQNRASEIDRLRAELDFQVNLKAEIAIQQLHRKIDELKANELRKLENFHIDQAGHLHDLVRLLKTKPESS
jgi:CRP/FNR family transcriptional regulator, cyclic AMP receptor protein